MDFQEIIASGKVELSGWEKLTHYSLVLALAGFSLMGLGFVLFLKNNAALERALYIFAILSSISIVFYFIQTRRLRFIVIETTLDHEQLAEVINYIAKRQKWKQKSRSKTFYVATCNDDWFISNGTRWGERITIAYHNKKIYFNSICDPKKRPTVTAWTRNWYHADVFKRAVRLLEEEVKLKSATT